MEHIEECGRCGSDPWHAPHENGATACLLCGQESLVRERWNREQRRIRTERINAAALAYSVASMQLFSQERVAELMPDEACIRSAKEMIDAQDAAAQERYRSKES